MGSREMSGQPLDDSSEAPDRNADSIRLIETAKRVCFFAHYHHLGLAAGHTLYYLDALKAAGFRVVVLSTATMSAADQDSLRKHCDVLIFRENVGLDFGGWMEALGRFPALQADLLLLTNDSVYGPITDLASFVDELTRTEADFYGAVENFQIAAHLQSWFVLLRPAAYRSDAFRSLMRRGVDPALTKYQIILSFEVGLTESLRNAGLAYHAAYSPRTGGRLGQRWAFSPTHILWRPLIERYGVPFLKIELMRYNPASVRSQREAIDVVRRLNPRLADLIVQDRAKRPEAHPPGGFAGWWAALHGTQPLGHWREVRLFLLRDDVLERTSWRSRANGVAFLVMLLVGKASRAVARPVENARRLLRGTPVAPDKA